MSYVSRSKSWDEKLFTDLFAQLFQLKYLFNVEAVFFSRDFSQDIIRRLEIEFISDLTKSYVSSACIISYSKRFQTLYSCTQRKRVLFEDVKKQLSKNWKISCRWSVLPSCLFNWRGFEYQTQETVEVLWFCSLESLFFFVASIFTSFAKSRFRAKHWKKIFWK